MGEKSRLETMQDVYRLELFSCELDVRLACPTIIPQAAIHVTALSRFNRLTKWHIYRFYPWVFLSFPLSTIRVKRYH